MAREDGACSSGILSRSAPWVRGDFFLLTSEQAELKAQLAQFTPKWCKNFSLHLLLPSNSPELQASPQGILPAPERQQFQEEKNWAFKETLSAMRSGKATF